MRPLEGNARPGLTAGRQLLQLRGMFLAALLLLVAPASQASPSQADLAREIAAEVDRYVAAVNRGDAREVADLYARRPGVSSAGDGEVTTGWSAVLALYRDFLEAYGRVRMRVDSLTVTPVGSNGALAVFKYEWMAVRDGDTVRYRGAMTLVYERSPQGWWVVHDHTSSERGGASSGAPAAEPAAAGVELYAGGPAGPLGPVERCSVSRVVDGDTFECAGRVRVRLIGIDTPELSQRPFGQTARDALLELLPVGSEVELERDVELSDRYGRRLAYVWRSGVLVNWQLVRGGWAVLLTVPPNVRYVEAFQEAQRRAREEARGLWAVDGFSCLPADRRRGRC